MPNREPFRRITTLLPLFLEMVRFGIMGLTSAGIYLVFFIPLRWVIPTRLWVSSAIAYLLSMVANYVLQRNFTFKSKRPHQEAVSRYLVVQFIGLGINSVLLELLTRRDQVPLWLAQGIAIVAVAVWSYLAQKLWVFFSHKPQGDPTSGSVDP